MKQNLLRMIHGCGSQLAPFFWKWNVLYYKTMARLIRETPILFGEDARRFLAAMEERRPEPPEVRARHLRNYEYMKKAYELGMAEKRAREEANGGIDQCFRKV